jgi:16S rRNA (guanine1207-N2)-methyltransferase
MSNKRSLHDTMITTTIKGLELQFRTEGGLFSPRRIDRGTLALLSTIEFDPEDRVCDLGCGYGVVGITAAKLIGPDRVLMIDNDPEAVACSRENARLNGVPEAEVIVSDGFSATRETRFTKIISHPPYHTDFSVPKRFIEKGFNRLALEGRFYMVTKRKEWYKQKLISIFGGVSIREVEGYYVFMAVKKSGTYAGVLASSR